MLLPVAKVVARSLQKGEGFIHLRAGKSKRVWSSIYA